MSNQQDPWQALEKKATIQLQLGTWCLDWPGNRLVHLVVEPSFQNAECWEVFDIQGDDDRHQNYGVIRRIWRYDLDYPDMDASDYRGLDSDDPRFREYLASVLPEKPTIEEVRGVVSAEDIDRILLPLKHLRLPVIPSDVEDGFDGVTFEAEFGGYFQGVRFRWWCDGPAEWRELDAVVGNLLAYLEERVGDAS